jgi:hypothetical protein
VSNITLAQEETEWMQTRLEEMGAAEGYACGEFKPVFPVGYPAHSSSQLPLVRLETAAGEASSPNVLEYSSSSSSSSPTNRASSSRTHEKRPNYFVGVRLVPPAGDDDDDDDDGPTSAGRHGFLRHVEEVVRVACQSQPGLLAGVVPSSTFHITLLTVQLAGPADVYRVARSLIDVEKTPVFQQLYSVLCRGGISFQKMALLSERLLVAVPGAG